MQDMIGTYRCLKSFPFPPDEMPRTDYCAGLIYNVRRGNKALADRMRKWVAEGLFEKISDKEPGAAITGQAQVRKKG